MGSKQQKRSSKSTAAPTAVSPVVRVGRGIRDLTRLLLVVRAGGRCAFDDHNEYLLQHRLTLTPGNFCAMAHIVAVKYSGKLLKTNVPVA